MFQGGIVDPQAHLRSRVAKAFFHAVTKHSEDNDDILPQEDGESKLSVYTLFAELFPEHVKDRKVSSSSKIGQGLTRLQFNKLGYEIYVKEQSRRVPAPHAKPGNPGYGFRRARWRNTTDNEDVRIMRETLHTIGVTGPRFEQIRARVEEFRLAWDQERRPSRPAGPGRPALRGKSEQSHNNNSSSDHQSSQQDEGRSSESPPSLAPLISTTQSEPSSFPGIANKGDTSPSAAVHLNSLALGGLLGGQLPQQLSLTSIASIYSLGQALNIDKRNSNVGCHLSAGLAPWSSPIQPNGAFQSSLTTQAAFQRLLAPPSQLLSNAQMHSFPPILARFPQAISPHNALATKMAPIDAAAIDFEACAERAAKRQRPDGQGSDVCNKASLAHLLACAE